MLKNWLSGVVISLQAKVLRGTQCPVQNIACHKRAICLSNVPILSKIQIWHQIKMSSYGEADGQVL